MTEHLVDRIYEAALNAELWPDVLDRMSRIAEAEGGVLFAAGTGAPQWTASERMRPHMEAFVREGWAARNDRGEAGFRKRIVGFATDHDQLSPEEIAVSPIYQGFFRPRGLGWSIGTAILPMTGDIFVLSLERRFERGPVEEGVRQRLDPLRPHLARSALTAAHLGLEQARGMVRGLEMIGLSAAVLTRAGTLVVANRPFEAMDEFAATGAFERLALKDAAAQKALTLALGHLGGARKTAGPPMSFPLRTPEGALAVAHLLPLVASARDLFNRGDALLILTRIGQPTVPGASLLEAIFDLTPAEARVASQLLDGVPAPAIARQFNVSHETVRSQMKAIFRKTGVARQIDLVRLVSGLPREA